MNETIELLITTLKRFEGLSLVAYQDAGGVWTLGYGETLGVTEGMTCTEEWAKDRLRYRALCFMFEDFYNCSQLLLEPPARIAAAVSLSYNIGIGAFKVSTVCRKTKQRLYKQAADAFLLWNKVGGRVNRGLIWRREIERNMYLLLGV